MAGLAIGGVVLVEAMFAGSNLRGIYEPSQKFIACNCIRQYLNTLDLLNCTILRCYTCYVCLAVHKTMWLKPCNTLKANTASKANRQAHKRALPFFYQSKTFIIIFLTLQKQPEQKRK